jgi:hypothetical protein
VIRVRYIMGGKETSHVPLVPHVPSIGVVNKAAYSETFVWIGTPVKPDASWDCGTDVVWPVLKLEGHPELELLKTPYVCRHMIEIGD